MIDPVRSRCLGIRIAAPSAPEVTRGGLCAPALSSSGCSSQIMEALDNVCRREGLSLPKQLAAKIAANSKGNLRRAILMLESSKVQRRVSGHAMPMFVCMNGGLWAVQVPFWSGSAHPFAGLGTVLWVRRA